MLNDKMVTGGPLGQPAFPEEIGQLLRAFTMEEVPWGSLLFCANLGFLLPTLFSATPPLKGIVH